MSKRLYTRKAGLELIRERRGIPISKSRLDKDCMPSLVEDGEEPFGPKPAETYGRVHLYTEEELLAYADRLLAKTGPLETKRHAKAAHHEMQSAAS